MLHRSALIVDDEPLLRMDAADTVLEIGFSVIEARTGDEALIILEGEHDIDLVLTDIQMPGDLDGLDLAKEIDKRWPEICVIVASGAVKPTPDELSGRAVFVGKPFAPNAIETALVDVCDRHDRRP